MPRKKEEGKDTTGGECPEQVFRDALHRFHSEKKDSPVTQDSSWDYGRGPVFYGDISSVLKAVEPILHKNDLSLRFTVSPVKDRDGWEALEAQVRHKNGVFISSLKEWRIPEGHPKPEQEFGKKCTYYKRYLLTGLLALQGGEPDGDGNDEKSTTQKKNPSNDGTPDFKELAGLVPEPPSLKTLKRVVFGLFLGLVKTGHSEEFLFKLIGINDWDDLKKRKSKEKILVKAKEILEKIKDGKD